ncbi:unnamed protein product [Clonostachys rosea]|uniref:Uncharacterized protein n=1 Tax=Bionectria ochroleuca TaxID=29856 RepID=A0ABY6UKM6_BIOOC|nr:unnamed protein product [Clonostachys rosea]
MDDDNPQYAIDHNPYCFTSDSFDASSFVGSGQDVAGDQGNSMARKSQPRPPSPLTIRVRLPGPRSLADTPSGDVENLRCVFKLLQPAAITGCIVKYYALGYYGAAGTFRWEFDVCVPSSELNRAAKIFDDNALYQRAKPPPKVCHSLRHMYPCFQLKGVMFYFLLVPSTQYFFTPCPATIEHPKGSLPYPKMPELAQSLLVLQDRNNLAAFIDALDLDEAWGDKHIDFNRLNVEGRKFAAQHNETFLAQNLYGLSTDTDFWAVWVKLVRTKEARIWGRYGVHW